MASLHCRVILHRQTLFDILSSANHAAVLVFDDARVFKLQTRSPHTKISDGTAPVAFRTNRLCERVKLRRNSLVDGLGFSVDVPVTTRTDAMNNGASFAPNAPARR